MASKNKKTPETASEKKCNCGPECTCGCNEGKECHCAENGGCGCGCGCNEGKECHCAENGGCGCGCGCRCGKRCGGKLIALLIVFLAGMGFNELLHGGCGRCPSKAPHHTMMSAPKHYGAMPMFSDGSGTVIIINAADGRADVFDAMHATKHFKKHKKCQKDMQMPQQDKPEMRKPHFSGKATIRPFSAQPKQTSDEDKKDD